MREAKFMAGSSRGRPKSINLRCALKGGRNIRLFGRFLILRLTCVDAGAGEKHLASYKKYTHKSARRPWELIESYSTARIKFPSQVENFCSPRSAGGSQALVVVVNINQFQRATGKPKYHSEIYLLCVFIYAVGLAKSTKIHTI